MTHIKWQTKKLGEIITMNYGKWLDKADRNPDGCFPVFWANGELGRSNNFLAQGESIIIGRKGSAGEVIRVSGKFWPSDVTYYVSGNYQIDLDYLFNFFKFTDLTKLARWVKPGINRNDVYSISIPLPPLPEQLRIVSILDEALEKLDQAKKNAEKNLQNAKEVFESYLQGVFENPREDWEEKMLVEITSHLGDGLHGTPEYTEDGEYHFINGNNLNDWVIQYKKWTKRVSIEEFYKYGKNLTDRTILVSINGTLGNVAFYNNEKIILGKSACYFNLNETVDKSYIKYVFSSRFFSEYAHKEATGATIKNVSLRTMREFKIPLPKLVEQLSIVSQLDALSTQTKRLQSIYQQKLANLDELRKSLLKKAFNGQL